MEIAKDRPSYVSFEVRTEEDRDASIKAGHPVSRDVDFALITPVGTKDRIERKVSDWLAMLEQYVREERMSLEWVTAYKAKYQAWKLGLEAPVEGTAILGSPMFTPAQQKNIIAANIRTIEDLAVMGDEAQKRIGMGALELKQKAANWLKVAGSVGTAAAQLSAQQVKINALEARVVELQDDKIKLQAEVNRLMQYAPKEKVA